MKKIVLGLVLLGLVLSVIPFLRKPETLNSAEIGRICWNNETLISVVNVTWENGTSEIRYYPLSCLNGCRTPRDEFGNYLWLMGYCKVV